MVNDASRPTPTPVPSPQPSPGARTRVRRTPRRGVSMLFVLVAALAVVAVLAFQAYRAEEDQRDTVARALHEYAGVAAWQFAADAKDEIGSALSELLSPIHQVTMHPGGTLPSPHMLEESQHRIATCNCGAIVLPAAYYFRLDLRTGALTVVGDHPADAAEQAWLTDTVAQYTHTIWDKNWRIAVIVGAVGKARRTAAFAVIHDTAGAPIAAYGVVNESQAFAAAIFPYVMNEWPLLPPSLTRMKTNHEVLSVSVTDESGHVVYQSAPQYDTTYTSYYPLQKFLAGFTVHATLRPELAQTLVLGGVPHRFPLMVALLVLTALLVSIAFRQLQRQAALASLRADFVASVSHELRTPLAQIRMFAELLRMGWVRSDQERDRSLEIIDQESRRLANLVDKVLTFENAEHAGARRIRPEFTPLATLVQEVLEAFQPLAASRQVTVLPLLDEECTAYVDRGAVRQMLINLLDNAVKYGPTGQTITVTLDTVGGRARISVEDEGRGVPSDERAAIWESFRRLDRDAHSAVAGSGIGLSVVKQLVDAHGGAVRVESSAAGGARFVIEIPKGS